MAHSDESSLGIKFHPTHGAANPSETSVNIYPSTSFHISQVSTSWPMNRLHIGIYDDAHYLLTAGQILQKETDETSAFLITDFITKSSIKIFSLLSNLRPYDKIRRALVSTWTVWNIKVQYECKTTVR